MKEDNLMLPLGTILHDCYEITEQLGKYGIQYEYRAYDRKMGRTCRVREFFMDVYAVRNPGEKEVQISFIREKDYKIMLQRLSDTAHLAFRVSGKTNILSLYDFFYENNTAYYVAEDVEAVNLESFCKNNGTLAESEIRNIAGQICVALKELHKASILHLNLVPYHILLCGDGRTYKEVKLFVNDECADMASDGWKKSHNCIIYPKYIPIEFYTFSQNKGTWTDVYMLGAVMYEMAVGHRPDEATNRIICDETKPPHELNPMISEKLSKIIMRALQIKPYKRYRTISRLMRAISK